MAQIKIRHLPIGGSIYTTSDISHEIIEWHVSDIDMFGENLFMQEPQTADVTIRYNGDTTINDMVYEILANHQEVISKQINEIISDIVAPVERRESTGILKAMVLIFNDDDEIIFKGFIDKESLSKDLKSGTWSFSAIDALYLYRLALEDAKVNVSRGGNGDYLTALQILKIISWSIDNDGNITDRVVQMGDDDERKLMYERDTIEEEDVQLVNVDDIKKLVNVSVPTQLDAFGFPVNTSLFVMSWNSNNVISGNRNVYQPFRFGNDYEQECYLNAFQRWIPSVVDTFNTNFGETVRYRRDFIEDSETEFIDHVAVDRVPGNNARFRYSRQYRIMVRASRTSGEDANHWRRYGFLVRFTRTIVFNGGHIIADNTSRTIESEWTGQQWGSTEPTPSMPDNPLLFSLPFTPNMSVTIGGNTYSVATPPDGYMAVINPADILMQIEYRYNGLLTMNTYNFGEEYSMPALDLLRLVCFTNNLRCYYDRLAGAVRFIKRTNLVATGFHHDYTITNNANIVGYTQSKLLFDHYDSKDILDSLYHSDYNLQRVFNRIYESILRNDSSVVEITLHRREGLLFRNCNLGQIISYAGKSWVIMSIGIESANRKILTLWEVRVDD